MALTGVDFTRNAKFLFSRGISNSVITSVNGGVVGANRGLIALAKAISLGNPADVARVNQRLASMMHESVKASYRATVEAQRKVPSYVRSNRYGGGALKRVIDAPDFVEGHSGGINYVNADRLNKEARHWKRLNFGALPVGASNPPGQFPLRFSGVGAASPLGFRAQPSAPFSLPKGFFIQGGRAVSPSREFRGRGSIGPFQPAARVFLRQTVGIRARNFLDAGLARLAREFEPEYEIFLRNQMNKGTVGGRAAKTELVKVPGNRFLV